MTLPQFPECKSIEIGDRELIEKTTYCFPPYSDFNFVSLWSWDLEGKMGLSMLHNNLVVRFSDYITGEEFYSFIGNSLISETASTILDHLTQTGERVVIRLVPEEIAKDLDQNVFSVTEDEDNFDYIYDTTELSELMGSKFAKKRNHVNSFTKEFPEVITRELLLTDTKEVTHIKHFFETLQSERVLKGVNEGFHDVAILERLLIDPLALKLFALGVFIEDRLVAILFNELIPQGYSIGHLMGADNKVSGGLYSFLMKKNAELLCSKGASRFNFEQDLGLENLRIAKTRFRPVAFLKKYTITYSPGENFKTT